MLIKMPMYSELRNLKINSVDNSLHHVHVKRQRMEMLNNVTIT